ncbi:hypothetical protein AAG906_019400 [Vitis piasezkii]
MLCRTLQKPMETVSCSVLHPLPFFNTCSYNKHFQFLKTQLSFLPTFSTNLHFPRKNFPHFNGLTAFRSLPPHNNPNPSQELAILLEVEGVIVDVYWMGNRNAFNTAFRKLGLDCANWPEPVYLDLLRKSAGDEERMLILFFNKIGWPTSVPTSEQKTFMQNVLREKKNALDDLLVSKGLPLRPGVEDFIDDAYNEGIPLLVLTPCCESEDKVRRFIADKLGPERISKVKIVGNEEVEQSSYGQIILGIGKGLLSGVDEQLAKEATKAVSAEKQRIAEEVASILKLKVEIGSGLHENLPKTIAALHAGSEYAGVPVNNCVLITGSQSGVAGAERVGMPYVVLHSREPKIEFSEESEPTHHPDIPNFTAYPTEQFREGNICNDLFICMRYNINLNHGKHTDLM